MADGEHGSSLSCVKSWSLLEFLVFDVLVDLVIHSCSCMFDDTVACMLNIS